MKRGIIAESTQLLTETEPFIKFVHTSLPFCEITQGIEYCQTLQELDISCRYQEGTKNSIIDELFHDEEDIEKQFIPLPGDMTELPKLNNQIESNDLVINEVKASLDFKIDKSLAQKDIRKFSESKGKNRSLHRPTPVKNYKLLNRDELESEDDVISEMRSLTIRPAGKENQSFFWRNNSARMKDKGLNQDSEIVVSDVNMKTKRKLIRWLEDINLIRKHAVSINEFPQFWRNGVIFYDLVNKINGRNPVLKGVQRNPRNITCITANYAKVMGYLRKFPKMNARYLWAENFMMEGNSDVIWGFIEDIWHWSNNKISPSDTSKTRNKYTKSESFNSSICSYSKINHLNYK